MGGIALECLGRALGAIDYVVFKKNPYTWDIARSTKDLEAGPGGELEASDSEDRTPPARREGDPAA